MQSEKGLSTPVVILSGSLLAILSLVVFLSLQFITTHFSPSFSSAERYLRQGKLDEAYAMVSNIKDESAKKALLRGRIFLAKSLQQRKIEGWRKYGNDSLDWLLGSDVDSALSCFKKAHSLGGQLPMAMYYLGVVYKEKGWLRDAEDALYETLRLDPDNVDARLALGSLFPLIDRLPEAVEQLKVAYYLAPENPQITKNIAFLYRFYLAIPESSIVWLNRYLNHAQTGDIDINMAKNEVNELLARYPEFAPNEQPEWQKKSRKFVSRKK